MQTNNIKIKVHTNWCDDFSLRNYLNKCTPNGDYVWKNLYLTDNNDYDFYVIFNHPTHLNFNPQKTIIFQAETPSTRARWGYFSNPDPHAFFKVYDTKRYHNVDKWFHSLTYKQLNDPCLFNKNKLISAIISSNNCLAGHKLRYDFLSYLDKIEGFDHYGLGTFNIKNHKGPINNKEDGLCQYKYTFNCENDFEPNYFTEKILDGIMCECLTFYDGCPNIDSFIDNKCYIKIDIKDPEKSLNIIKESILNNEYEKRIDYIKKEKQRVINDLNPLNIVWKIINQQI